MLFGSKCLTSLVPPPVVTADACIHQHWKMMLPLLFFFFVLCCCRLIKVLAEFRLKSLSGFHSSECWGNLRSFFLKWICDLFRSMERIQSWGCRYFAGLINPMEIERSSPLFANNSWSIQSHPHMWACEVCTNSQRRSCSSLSFPQPPGWILAQQQQAPIIAGFQSVHSLRLFTENNGPTVHS